MRFRFCPNKTYIMSNSIIAYETYRMVLKASKILMSDMGCYQAPSATRRRKRRTAAQPELLRTILSEKLRENHIRIIARIDQGEQ